MFLLNDQGRTIIESAGRLNVNQSRPHRFHGTLLLSLSLSLSLSLLLLSVSSDYKSVRFYGCAFFAGDLQRAHGPD